MDLSLRDALGGGGGGVPGGAPAEALMKRDFMSALEKESYDDKVGETMTKSDYRPLLDGKDGKSGLGMTSSVMLAGGRQDPPGQPAFASDYLSGPMTGGTSDRWSQNKTRDTSTPDSFLGFSQSGMSGNAGSSLPPFQTNVHSTLGQVGMAKAADAQKTTGLLASEPQNVSLPCGINPFKPNEPFSSGGPGIQSLDRSAAPPLCSPSGSVEDSSPTSSTSEPLSPERSGCDAGKQQQRRKKKKRKGRDEAYDFLDSQEKNGHSDKRGLRDQGGREAEEDDEEADAQEWEVRESGAGGRVKGKKSKSRARLPEEWGAPVPAAAAPTWTPATDFGALDRKAGKSDQGQGSSAPMQIATGLTNRSRDGLAADSSLGSFEPGSVQDYPMSTGDWRNVTGVSVPANASDKSRAVGDLALTAGGDLSPVSQTFSFLDAVLQTPPGSTPDSQHAAPITNAPLLATAASSVSTDVPVPSSGPPSGLDPYASDAPPTSAVSSKPRPSAVAQTPNSKAALESVLNVDARPFVPSASRIAAVAGAAVNPPPALGSEAVKSASPESPTKAEATLAAFTSPAVTPSLLTHPKQQESASPLLSPLEGW